MFKGAKRMNLCSYPEIVKLLKKHGFNFSKALGQNFIVDEHVCPKMVRCLNADRDTGVLEIGPGIGVLTKELCAVAGRVASVELDKRLYPILEETLAGFSNFELVEGDVLKLDLKAVIRERLGDKKEIKVCANLPYYITSPVIMKLIESDLPISEIVIMVQKEAAQKLTAKVGTRECTALSVATQYYAETEKLFDVGRGSFIPQPKVDSAVIKLTVRKRPAVDTTDEKHFFQIIRAAFSQRRKTALNCLSSALGLPKETVHNALITAGLNETDRAETFTLEDFAKLCELL